MELGNLQTVLVAVHSRIKVTVFLEYHRISKFQVKRTSGNEMNIHFMTDVSTLGKEMMVMAEHYVNQI